jgi:hypothetical protein
MSERYLQLSGCLAGVWSWRVKRVTRLIATWLSAIHLKLQECRRPQNRAVKPPSLLRVELPISSGPSTGPDPSNSGTCLDVVNFQPNAEDDDEEEAEAEVETVGGITPVRSLSLHFFRSKLITHFAIALKRNEVVWPRRLQKWKAVKI